MGAKPTVRKKIREVIAPVNANDQAQWDGCPAGWNGFDNHMLGVVVPAQGPDDPTV